MTYRDEKGALQAKVGELESEIEAAHRKIAELSGTAPTAKTSGGETLGPLSGLGTPTSLRIEKVIEGALTTQGYEAIAVVIRERLGLTTTQVGTRMETLHNPRAPAGRVEISVKDGRTHILLERDWSDRAGSTWVFAGMAAMFGGVATAALMHDLFHLSDAMSFVHILWGAPLFGALTASLVRPRARAQVEAELAARRGAFLAIVELAEQHRTSPVRARVAVDGGPAVGDAAEESAAESARFEGRAR